ncbi:hypothetical protein [Campylobacter lanienae]|nr:hypothetical protein [Campylobacter lanienae]
MIFTTLELIFGFIFEVLFIILWGVVIAIDWVFWKVFDSCAELIM